jgi:hypothetical protein
MPCYGDVSESQTPQNAEETQRRTQDLYNDVEAMTDPRYEGRELLKTGREGDPSKRRTRVLVLCERASTRDV